MKEVKLNNDIVVWNIINNSKVELFFNKKVFIEVLIDKAEEDSIDLKIKNDSEIVSNFTLPNPTRNRITVSVDDEHGRYLYVESHTHFFQIKIEDDGLVYDVFEKNGDELEVYEECGYAFWEDF